MANSVTDKLILSASTDGKGIKIAATATAGTLVHTWPTNTATYHEVYLYAYNSSTTVNQDVTVEFGDATAPDSNIRTNVTIGSWLNLIVPWLLLKGNATPLTVKVFSTTTNVTIITWYYHLIA